MASIEDFLSNSARESARTALFEQILTPEGKEFLNQCMNRVKREDRLQELTEAVAEIIRRYEGTPEATTGYEMVQFGVTILLGAIASLHYFNNERSLGN